MFLFYPFTFLLLKVFSGAKVRRFSQTFVLNITQWMDFYGTNVLLYHINYVSLRPKRE